VTTANSLSPLRRLQLREQLQEFWREQVEILAVVDYRAGRRKEASGGVDPGELERRRASARTALVEVEAAMQRMDCRRYGLCEQCTEPIPIVDLLTTPHRRRCSACEGPATMAVDSVVTEIHSWASRGSDDDKPNR
jgi:RNA polymerase-binding transcription factor DksA